MNPSKSDRPTPSPSVCGKLCRPANEDTQTGDTAWHSLQSQGVYVTSGVYECNQSYRSRARRVSSLAQGLSRMLCLSRISRLDPGMRKLSTARANARFDIPVSRRWCRGDQEASHVMSQFWQTGLVRWSSKMLFQDKKVGQSSAVQQLGT